MQQHNLQNSLYDNLEAGCDEAGRGPLAGPVFAAAVIMPKDFHHSLLNDSKKMTRQAREQLRPIIESEAVAFAVASVSAREIDKINILNAAIAAMQRAILSLGVTPNSLLIDGNRFRSFTYIRDLLMPGLYDTDEQTRKAANENLGLYCDAALLAHYDTIPYKCIVKGDAKFVSIAAASVLAKTYRDEFMRNLAAEYPEYHWDKNMGYPTKEHLDAIARHGLTPNHRLSFAPCKSC